MTRGEAEAERDQRRLGTEHEAEPERGEGGEEDAAEVGRAERPHTEPFERAVATVAGQPQRRGHENPRQTRHEHDVPPGRLAPAEPIRDDLPDEVNQIVELPSGR